MTGGVCGGVWNGDNRFSAGGMFATNQITGTYTAGQTIDVTVSVCRRLCAPAAYSWTVLSSGRGFGGLLPWGHDSPLCVGSWGKTLPFGSQDSKSAAYPIASSSCGSVVLCVLDC